MGIELHELRVAVIYLLELFLEHVRGGEIDPARLRLLEQDMMRLQAQMLGLDCRESDRRLEDTPASGRLQ